MFQKNLDVIKNKNPKLAERLEKIDINSITGIEVFESETKDLIISYKNTVLHSAIDPVREAKTTWNRTIKNELKKNDIQVVFGLGLGYLFKRAYVNAESKIFVIEPFIEVLRFVLEHVDFSKELSDARIYIADNVGDIYDKLQKEYLSGDRVEFLFLNHYALANQELLQDLTCKTIEIAKNRGNDETTIFHLSKSWTENFIKNIINFPKVRPLGFFEGKFADKIALIIAPGPSLAGDLEKIKANQDKFTIISVGKVFKALVKADIIPDFTVFADARECIGQIRGVEESLEKTNLVLLSKADNCLYNLKSKSKILYLSETDSMAKLLEDQNLYKSGSSVSIISYYFAKAMGFGQIAFSGLDLAYIDSNFYHDDNLGIKEYMKCFKFKFLKHGKIALNNSEIKGYDWFIRQFEKISIKEESYSEALEPLELSKILDVLIPNFKFMLQNQELIYVKDKEGNDIPTRTDYAWFIRQFNEIFTEEINLAKIINTSSKGAFINGMEYMEFSEFVKTLSGSKPDIDEIISSVFDETKKSWDSEIMSVSLKLKQINEELVKISTDSAFFFEELNKICLEFRETGKTEYNPEAYSVLNNRAIETRQMIIRNVFLSNSMQFLLWNYTRTYVTKTLPSKEEVIGNIELDRDFFKNAQEECNQLSGILNETLKALEVKQDLLIK